MEIVRIPCKCVPGRLISAFQTNKRSLDRPNIMVSHSFINDIEKEISNIDQADSLNSRDHIHFDEIRWTELEVILELKKWIG